MHVPTALLYAATLSHFHPRVHSQAHCPYAKAVFKYGRLSYECALNPCHLRCDLHDRFVSALESKRPDLLRQLEEQKAAKRKKVSRAMRRPVDLILMLVKLTRCR